MKKKQQSPLWRSPLNSTHVVLSWFTSDVNVGVTVNERLDVNMQSGAVFGAQTGVTSPVEQSQ